MKTIKKILVLMPFIIGLCGVFASNSHIGANAWYKEQNNPANPCIQGETDPDCSPSNSGAICIITGGVEFAYAEANCLILLRRP